MPRPREPNSFINLVSATLQLDLKDKAARLLEVSAADLGAKKDSLLFNMSIGPGFLARLAILAEKQVDLLDVTKSLIINALEFISSTVARTKPIELANWARKKRECSCGDCYLLDSFLVNPTQRVGRFQTGERRRSHLERRLNAQHFKIGFEGNRSCYVLVVTKTMREYEDAFKKWKRDCDLLERQMEHLKIPAMARLLRASSYKDLVCLDCNSPPSHPMTGDQRQTLAPSAGLENRRPPTTATTTGMKRKAETGESLPDAKGRHEVVDLCSDSEDAFQTRAFRRNWTVPGKGAPALGNWSQ
jgi:hypothetical protein